LIIKNRQKLIVFIIVWASPDKVWDVAEEIKKMLLLKGRLKDKEERIDPSLKLT